MAHLDERKLKEIASLVSSVNRIIRRDYDDNLAARMEPFLRQHLTVAAEGGKDLK